MLGFVREIQTAKESRLSSSEPGVKPFGGHSMKHLPRVVTLLNLAPPPRVPPAFKTPKGEWMSRDIRISFIGLQRHPPLTFFLHPCARARAAVIELKRVPALHTASLFCLKIMLQLLAILYQTGWDCEKNENRSAFSSSIRPLTEEYHKGTNHVCRGARWKHLVRVVDYSEDIVLKPWAGGQSYGWVSAPLVNTDGFDWLNGSHMRWTRAW